jgi:hypothetical protein
MTRLVSTLSDPVWWFTAVVVGTLIQVVAALILRRLDRKMANLSMAWRNRSEHRRSARAQRVALLKNDQQFLYLALFEEMRYRSRGTNFFLLAVALFVLGGTTALPAWVRPFFLMLGALTLAIGQLAVRQAANLLFEIIDSRDPAA